MVTSVIEQLMMNCVAPFPMEDDSMSMNQTMGETKTQKNTQKNILVNCQATGGTGDT